MNEVSASVFDCECILMGLVGICDCLVPVVALSVNWPMGCCQAPYWGSPKRIHLMYYSLTELRDKIDRLIQVQGEDAPVASFIFTKEDVCISDWMDDSHNVIELDCDSLEQMYPRIIERVLSEVGDSDYIYEQINDSIMDEIELVRKSGSV